MARLPRCAISVIVSSQEGGGGGCDGWEDHVTDHGREMHGTLKSWNQGRTVPWCLRREHGPAHTVSAQ